MKLPVWFLTIFFLEQSRISDGRDKIIYRGHSRSQDSRWERIGTSAPAKASNGRDRPYSIASNSPPVIKIRSSHTRTGAQCISHDTLRAVPPTQPPTQAVDPSCTRAASVRQIELTPLATAPTTHNVILHEDRYLACRSLPFLGSEISQATSIFCCGIRTDED